MADTGLKSPTATGLYSNQWTNPTYAYSSNNQYAEESSLGQSQDYYNFTFGVPAGATINGVEVQLEAKYAGVSTYTITSSVAGTGDYSALKETSNLTTSDATYTLGGSADLWGLTWNADDFSNTNFLMFIRYSGIAGTIYVDQVQTKVYYTAGAAGPSILGWKTLLGVGQG